MNTKEKEIDTLTRRLMQGTAEQPSSSLNARIMALIGKRRRHPAEMYVGRAPSVGLILVCLWGYLLLVAAGAFCLRGPSDVSVAGVGSIRQLFPAVLTVGGAGFFFFCFAQLDTWLVHRGKKRSQPLSEKEAAG